MRTVRKAYETASLHHQRDELIVAHLEFVRHILGKVAANLPEGIDIENLESAGVMGLVEAAQQYDFNRGVSFKTFSYSRIRGAIIDELRRNCPLPQQVLQQVARIRSALEQLEPPATPEIIARQTNLTVAEVENCLQAMRLTRPGSWDENAVSQHHTKDANDAPEAPLELNESKKVLSECIEKLPDQERIVVTLYYMEDLRLKEIGRVLNLSESRVSRILTKAEFRLREFVCAKERV